MIQKNTTMIKFLKNVIKEVVSEIIDDFKDENYIIFSLIEDNKKIAEIELLHKPSQGDIIHNSNEKYEMFHYKFKIQEVELSHTGSTGNLYGKKQ